MQVFRDKSTTSVVMMSSSSSPLKAVTVTHEIVMTRLKQTTVQLAGDSSVKNLYLWSQWDLIVTSLWCINILRWMNLIVASWPNGSCTGLEFYDTIVASSIPTHAIVSLRFYKPCICIEISVV